jgi:integrase/recombinase XerD
MKLDNPLSMKRPGRRSFLLTLKFRTVGLRVWFRHCETREWVRPGFAATILMPRIYTDERLPIGRTWDQVGRVVTEADGDTPRQRRNGAILRLLAVRRGCGGSRCRMLIGPRTDHPVQERKARHPEPSVAHALSRYVRDARPQSHHAAMFLIGCATFRPLSAAALHRIVSSHWSITDGPQKGRAPHGLRHACARHLIEAGGVLQRSG